MNNVPIASTGDMTNDWWNPETKTLYDPCPYGYKIPKHGTYGNVANTTNPSDIGWDWSANGLASGMTWKTSFFPATGNRHYSNGYFGAIGSGSNIWTSTPANLTHGFSIYFRYKVADPNTADTHSYSFNVRCIAE